MNIELAKFLEKATEHCGSQDIDVRESYSGRGMYGNGTAAVVVDSVPELLMNVIQYIKEIADMQPGISAERFSEVIPDVSDMGHLRTDNMGRSTVVY